MTFCRSYALLGTHPVSEQHGDDELFDAFDAVVELDDGTLAVVGVRTVGYVESSPEPDWSAGYSPIKITLDLATVEFFDFSEILWLGPSPQPCLLWSNAEGLRRKAVEHLISRREGSKMFLGEHGCGLPTPESLGIVLHDHLDWRPVVGGSDPK